MLLLDIPITGKGTIYVDIILALLLIAGIIYTCIRYKFSFKVIAAATLFIFFYVISIVFDLKIVEGVTIVFAIMYCVYVSLLTTSTEKESELRYHKKISKKDSTLTKDEREELVENLTIAVNALSSSQTGALITIEMEDDLSRFMVKSGTAVNAPVTPELLETIFYKGTPLHDGATIIRGNKVVTSAVFYQPTQQPLNGKYGSRHRAAIGISEVCDALTIIVSEETGKVAFAYKGQLFNIPVDSFETRFKEIYLRDK